MSSGNLIIHGVLSGSLKNEILISQSSPDMTDAVATAKEEAIQAAKIETTTQVNALADGQVKTNKEDISDLQEAVRKIQMGAYDDTEIRDLINDLDEIKANATDVVEGISIAVKSEEDARKKAVANVQNAVNTLSDKHATDKATLELAIGLKASQESLDTVSSIANAAVKQTDYDVKVKALEDEDARIADLVTAETERITALEAKFGEGEGSIEDMISEVKSYADTEVAKDRERLVSVEAWQEQFQVCSKQDILDLFANN